MDKKSKPRNMTQMESVHFAVQGEFITERIRAFILEHKMTMANELFDCLIPMPNAEERQLVIQGEGKFTGWTLCNDMECGVCKDIRKDGHFRFIKYTDKAYKNKLKKHEEYLKKYTIEIDGDIAIDKKIVSELVIAKTELEGVKKVRYKNNEYDRLNDRKLQKSYLEALDGWELAQDMLYQQFQVLRSKDYPVGTREWKAKLDAESIIDVVISKAIYDEEIQKLVQDAKNTGTTSAMAVEKMYAYVSKGREMEDPNLMAELAEDIERPKKAKPTKDTVNLANFDVPKYMVDDYANAVKNASSSAMLFKAKYGKLDPLVEQKRLETRIQLHKKIFDYCKLPYHQDIDHKKKKLSKLEKKSIQLQNALTEYLEKN